MEGIIFAVQIAMNSITRSITFILLLSLSTLNAQQIKVVNNKSGEPVSDVFIYHLDKSINTVSDQFGQADLSDFPQIGQIVFSHPSFQVLTVQRNRIEQEGFKIKLNEKIIEFKEVVVSANKWEQDIDEIPQQITKISAQQIEFNNPQTSADLLAQSGEVFVQKSQFGGGSPMIRGFAANSVLLVVDGIRLNNAIYRGGNLQNIINIDPNSVENAEVVYGPGSVIYGSDALGGVMSFTTISPPLKPNNFKVGAFTRYSSASDEQTGHINVSLGNKKIGYFGSVSYSNIGDLRSGKNRSDAYIGYFERNLIAGRSGMEDVLIENEKPEIQKSSGFNTFHTLQKLTININDHAQLALAYHHGSTSNIPRYDALTERLPGSDSLRYAEWFYGPQDWSMYALSFNSSKSTALYTRIQATLGLQDYKESRNDRDFGADQLNTRKERVSMLTGNVSFEKQYRSSTLFYGVDFAYNYVKSRSQSRDINSGERFEINTRYPDGGSMFYTSAAYINYLKRYGEKWVVSIGGRYSQVNLKAATNNETASILALGDISQSNSALNGSASVILNTTSSTQLKLALSSGFRAPNVDDVGKVFDLGNVITVSNPNLKPEYSYNYELGFSKRTDKISFSLVAFQSFLTDAIVTGSFLLNGETQYTKDGQTFNVEAQVNAGQATIFGSSLNIKSVLTENLAFANSISYNRGYQLNNNEPLRHIPPVFGRTALLFKQNRLQAEVYAEYNFNKDKDLIPSNEFDNKPHLYTSTGSPGWITLNLKSAYHFNKYVELQVGLENIFDQHYRPYSSGISAAGRNFIITLRGNF